MTESLLKARILKFLFSELSLFYIFDPGLTGAAKQER
jgi:DUF1365 family protein